MTRASSNREIFSQIRNLMDHAPNPYQTQPNDIVLKKKKEISQSRNTVKIRSGLKTKKRKKIKIQDDIDLFQIPLNFNKVNKKRVNKSSPHKLNQKATQNEIVQTDDILTSQLIDSKNKKAKEPKNIIKLDKRVPLSINQMKAKNQYEKSDVNYIMSKKSSVSRAIKSKIQKQDVPTIIKASDSSSDNNGLKKYFHIKSNQAFNHYSSTSSNDYEYENEKKKSFPKKNLKKYNDMPSSSSDIQEIVQKYMIPKKTNIINDVVSHKPKVLGDTYIEDSLKNPQFDNNDEKNHSNNKLNLFLDLFSSDDFGFDFSKTKLSSAKHKENVLNTSNDDIIPSQYKKEILNQSNKVNSPKMKDDNLLKQSDFSSSIDDILYDNSSNKFRLSSYRENINAKYKYSGGELSLNNQMPLSKKKATLISESLDDSKSKLTEVHLSKSPQIEAPKLTTSIKNSQSSSDSYYTIQNKINKSTDKVINPNEKAYKQKKVNHFQKYELWSLTSDNKDIYASNEKVEYSQQISSLNPEKAKNQNTSQPINKAKDKIEEKNQIKYVDSSIINISSSKCENIMLERHPKSNVNRKKDDEEKDNNLSARLKSNFEIVSFPIKNHFQCFAVGDIEGDPDKLQAVIDFIDLNPDKSFVFLGDLFDDISDNNKTKEANWKCLKIISRFLSDFSTLEENNNLIKEFKSLEFKSANYDEIKNRIKFIAGNSECDVLYDIGQTYQGRDNDGLYKFGKGRWEKTLTFDQIRLLYQYFLNCYGYIKLNRDDKTLYFRHAAAPFKTNVKITQIPNNIKGDFKCVVGHSHTVNLGESQMPQGKAYIIDTSPNKYLENNQQIVNYKTLGVVTFEKESGFDVEQMALPAKFHENPNQNS